MERPMRNQGSLWPISTPTPDRWAIFGIGGKMPLTTLAASVILHGAVTAAVLYSGSQSPVETDEPIIIEMVFLSPIPGLGKEGNESERDLSEAPQKKPAPIEPVETVQSASAASPEASKNPAKQQQKPARQNLEAMSEGPSSLAFTRPLRKPEPPRSKPGRKQETAEKNKLSDTPPSTMAPEVNVVSATVLKGNKTIKEGLTENNGGGFIAPRFQLGSIRNPIPRYPRRARQQGIEGRVVLRVRVDAAGRPSVISVLKSSGHAILDNAAAETFRDWRFKPALKSGIAVAAAIDIPISFRLRD